MNNKQFDKDYRSISIIDDLIMELSLLKSGKEELSKEKIQQGLELIEYLMTRLDRPNQEVQKENFGISPVPSKPTSYSSSYKINTDEKELKKIKHFLKRLRENPQTIDKEEIELFQDQLLQLSLPIWENQVIVIRQSRINQIEF